jgi:hypothetical protein
MSILGNQTAINTTTDFFALAKTATAPIIRYIIDPSEEAVDFGIGSTTTIATFPIPDQYEPEDNFTFYCLLQLTAITGTGEGFFGLIDIALQYSNGVDSFLTRAPILASDGITATTITLPPFIANTGSGSTFTISLINNTNQGFSAEYAFQDAYFLRLSSGGIEV